MRERGMMTADLPVPGLEPAFDVSVRLGPLEDHGVTRSGHRRVVPIVGGQVTGAIEGEILAGGADWQRVRPDGTVELDARYSVRLADDSLVYLRAEGVRSGPPEVLAALLRGEAVDPTEYYFRTVITVESADRPDLEQSLFIGACVRHADAVSYRAYRVT